MFSTLHKISKKSTPISLVYSLLVCLLQQDLPLPSPSFWADMQLHLLPSAHLQRSSHLVVVHLQSAKKIFKN